MRLIDADSFKKFLTKLYEAGAPYDGIIELLDKQPTAYDVDKVIKGLEKLKETEQNREDECDEEGNGDAEQIFSDGESRGKFRAYIKAIEVVKAG